MLMDRKVIVKRLGLFAISATSPFLVVALAFSTHVWAKGPSDGRCAIHPLSGWSEKGAQWLGACANGMGNGLGALKYYADGSLRETFLGELRDGYPVIGVIDKGAGYVAGRFVGGKVQETDDRNEILKAFRVASRAAEAVSESFARKGNKASAAFYRDLAAKLASQMD
jgi:hypothetical protein